MSTMATSPEKTTSSITVRTRVWYDLMLTETGYTIKNCQTQCEAKQASSFGSYTPLMIYEYWGLSATDEGGNTVWLVSSGQTSISMGVVSTTGWSGSTPHSGSGTLTGTRGHSAKTVSLVTNHCGFKDDGASNHYSGTPVTVTIPAKASYAVSFNANGGSGTPSAQTKWYNESLTITSTKPTRSGYSFIKWNTKSDGTGTDYASGSTYTRNSAITLYAIWGPIVSYNANGGSGAPAQAVKTPGTPITISTTQPTRAGYTFSKWNTSADGSGTDYSPGASYSTDAPLVLYAQWTPNTYQVSFDANTGKHAPSAITRTYGQPVTLPSTVPVKMAADFVGWATNSSGTGTLYQPGGSYTSTVAAVEILYAVWRSTYTDPAFAIDVVRTDDHGDEEDDGDHALITVLWSINPLIEPDTGESTNTATLECYMSYIDSQGHTITTEVELEDVGGTNETQGTKTSGEARALVSNIDTDTRYTIEVTVVDSRETSVTKTEILSMAFFTMDFLAGGHGVAFGKPSKREMFDVGMQAQFDKPIMVAETDVPPTFYFTTKPDAADLPVRPCIVIQTSDWSVWYCDDEETSAYHRLNTDTNTTYSAGIGLALSGTTFRTTVPRVTKNANYIPGNNTIVFEEYAAGTKYNLPSNHWYYIITMQGSDSAYAIQFAIGETTEAAFYRRYVNKAWQSWVQLSHNGHTHSYFPLSGGNVNGSVLASGSIQASRGQAYNFVVGGGNSYVWIDCRNASGKVRSNIVMYDNRIDLGGSVHFANNTWNQVGDDIYMGDCNYSNTLGLKGMNSDCQIVMKASNNNDTFYALRTTGNNGKLSYMTRADNYLHVETQNYGSYGVTWWSSDARMKDNIEDSDVDALELVNSIEHRSFDMNGEHYQIGYIAQELEELDPQLVIKIPQSRNENGQEWFTGDYRYQIDPNKVIPYLSKAIQELSVENDELKRKNEELELRLEAIERKLGL